MIDARSTILTAGDAAEIETDRPAGVAVVRRQVWMTRDGEELADRMDLMNFAMRVIILRRLLRKQQMNVLHFPTLKVL